MLCGGERQRKEENKATQVAFRAGKKLEKQHKKKECWDRLPFLRCVAAKGNVKRKTRRRRLPFFPVTPEEGKSKSLQW
ncbi:MAG TPA: hypothetical protein DEO89_06005 [Lachnospiraceae bacterium]|nr:hypothetical protein [Lachnospiraceae bacterium]